MLKLLQSTWMTAVIGAVVFAATIFLTLKQLPPPAPAAAPKTTPETKGDTFVLANNLELDDLVKELQKRKTDLDEREKQLNDYALRLKTEKAELDKILDEVRRTQKGFDEGVTLIEKNEADNLKKLARTYAAMTPDNAAPILRRLDDPTIAKILVNMKEEETARIFEAMSKTGDADAKRVAALSERLRMASSRQAPDKQPAP